MEGGLRFYLHYNVKPVRVGLLDSLELDLGVASRKSNIFIGSIQLLGQIHLQTLGGCNDYMGATVVLEELGKAEPGRAGTKHENRRSELGSNLLQTVAGARRRLQEGSLDIAEVVDLEDFAGRVGTVFGKTTIHWRSRVRRTDGPWGRKKKKTPHTGHAVSLKVLAEEGLSPATVEALSAELRVVGAHALANREALDILSNRSHNTNGFMPYKWEHMSEEKAV